MGKTYGVKTFYWKAIEEYMKGSRFSTYTKQVDLDTYIYDIYKNWIRLDLNQTMLQPGPWLCLALMNIEKKWNATLHNWGLILHQFLTIFEDRCRL